VRRKKKSNNLTTTTNLPAPYTLPPSTTTTVKSPIQIIILLLLAATLSALPAIPLPTINPPPIADTSRTPSTPAAATETAGFATPPVAAPVEFKSFGTDECLRCCFVSVRAASAAVDDDDDDADEERRCSPPPLPLLLELAPAPDREDSAGEEDEVSLKS
jgi:hypothetical protein